MPLLSDVELAALLCSRVCHDVISPVGAIANGLEVLDDEDDEQMKAIALDLIRRSARQASAKLQFCRMAFGASGSAGALLDLGEAEQVTRAFIGEERVKLSWEGPQEMRPKLEVKLLLNMVLIAMTTIPRGGTVAVGIDGDVLAVRSTGEGAKIPEKTARVLVGETTADEIDPRHAQVYYTARLADAASYEITMALDADGVATRATPLAAG